MKDYGHYIEVPIPDGAYVVGTGESLDLTFTVLSIAMCRSPCIAI